MDATLLCPGCHARLTLPSLTAGATMQCTRCGHSFEPIECSSSAVTAVPPFAGGPSAATGIHELSERPRPRVLLHPFADGWIGMVARLALAASVAAFAMPAAFVAYDHAKQWLALEIRFGDDGRIPLQHREVSMLIDFSIFWIQIAIWPALIAFAFWLYVASRNARLLAAGLTFSSLHGVAVFFLPINGIVLYMILRAIHHWNPSLCWVIGLFFVPAVSVIVVYLHLQEIWRASDPYAIKRLDSWRKTRANPWIRLWALFCLGVPLLAGAGVIDDCWGRNRMAGVLFLLAPLSLAIAGVVLIAVIRSITVRQRERYHRLYEDPA